MPRKTVGPVTARRRAQQAVAQLAAERAQRDQRIAAQAEEFFKAADTIDAAEQEIERARTNQITAVGRLSDEAVSIDEIALMLGIDAAQVRSLRKASKQLQVDAADDSDNPPPAQS